MDVIDTGRLSETWSASFGGHRLLYGPGSLDRLAAEARLLGTRALVVTDPGVRAAGHADRAARLLGEGSIATAVFDGVEENPTTRHVAEGVRAARAAGADLIVGVGGGSAMDCAKGINFIVTNGGRMEDYHGYGLASRPLLPSIGIPTTAGTGSEAQSYAVIEQEAGRRKMACGDVKARFRCVILDPALTVSLPRRVAALSGMDAISHAVESHVSTAANPISRMMSREAWALLSSAFASVLAPAAGETARGRMMLGAHLAGAAIEASMLGAAHACANPLTSRLEIPHGAAVLLMLPHVVRFNEPVAGHLYDELKGADPAAAGRPLADRIEQLRSAGGLPGRLGEAGVPRSLLPSLADEAAEQWTARYNPRPVDRGDLLRLYEAAY